MLHTNHSRIQEVIMHSNLRLEVPESVLSDGIFKDNKPLSAISLKTLLFLMYYFDGNCEDKVTVPLRFVLHVRA